jgi:hypothetical protein
MSYEENKISDLIDAGLHQAEQEYFSKLNKRISIHYAPSGEWGSTRVRCNRYFTTDVYWSGNINSVTCKNCLKKLK